MEERTARTVDVVVNGTSGQLQPVGDGADRLTVLQSHQDDGGVGGGYPKLSPLHLSNRLKFFRIKARESDCTLLPVDGRTCKIPRQIKGGMGQANVWYADSPLSMPTVKRVRQLLAGKKPVIQHRSGQKEKQDQERKARVEKAVIRTTNDHYESLGYTVRSVVKDNVGGISKPPMAKPSC
jgi:hypothetical protein